MSKDLPKLEVMLIGEADELEEIFKSLGDDHKVEIPTPKFVAFVKLSLCHVQGIQFQTIEYHFVQNCKKLSLTSLTSSRDVFRHKIFGMTRIGTHYIQYFSKILHVPCK
jgi:hypothetical protein